jgi:hypothetical protein
MDYKQVVPIEDSASDRLPELRQDHIMRFFGFRGLESGDSHRWLCPEDISSKFSEFAQWITANLPRGPERTVALRKLLESKDAAIRSLD